MWRTQKCDVLSNIGNRLSTAEANTVLDPYYIHSCIVIECLSCCWENKNVCFCTGNSDLQRKIPYSLTFLVISNRWPQQNNEGKLQPRSQHLEVVTICAFAGKQQNASQHKTYWSDGSLWIRHFNYCFLLHYTLTSWVRPYTTTSL